MRGDPVFDYDRTDDRLTLRRPGTRWLSNGFDGTAGLDRSPSDTPTTGGYGHADAAHNLTVPDGFDRTDLTTYTEERLVGQPPGPTLLTGVFQRHARGARRGPVEVVATAGLSNPAVLPMDDTIDEFETRPGPKSRSDRRPRPGTVNLFVGTTRALGDGALAGLLATAVEAKAATLLEVAGVPGTTSDAVVVGCDPDGESTAFAGSATEVGAAARVCVREAVSASVESRYGDAAPPPDDAEYGVVSDQSATVFEP